MQVPSDHGTDTVDNNFGTEHMCATIYFRNTLFRIDFVLWDQKKGNPAKHKCTKRNALHYSPNRTHYKLQCASQFIVRPKRSTSKVMDITML